MYRDESHAVDELIWTARDTWADAILEQWGRWSRSHKERIDYPSSQPFATKTGGGLPVSEDLAERAEAALRRMDAGWRAVLKTKYHNKGYMAPRTHLRAMREFADAYENL